MDLIESVEAEEFPVGDNKVIAVANVPMMTCSTCNFSFTDFRAEDIRHDAACLALGLLTPRQIKEVRAIYDMTRRDFASAFHIGHASLERWENRKLFVGGQSNFYLRALQDKAVGSRLLNESAASNQPDAAGHLPEAGSNVIAVDFKHLRSATSKLESAISRKELFSLKQSSC